jgi:hypothetical protein
MNKSFEMPLQLQMPLKISREFLSGDWQYLWRNIRAIQTASLFCFGPFVFTVMSAEMCLFEPAVRKKNYSVGPFVEKKVGKDKVNILSVT